MDYLAALNMNQVAGEKIDLGGRGRELRWSHGVFRGNEKASRRQKIFSSIPRTWF
jgi:hypothetical protein